MGNAPMQTADQTRRFLLQESVQGLPVPWYISLLVCAAALDAFGTYWDISWHISIGRDSFWTPAHVTIYMGGLLTAIACSYCILTTTFASAENSTPAVHVLGFRGPLGCFVSGWGVIAMLTSAPFDNWWHSAYGLDVKIVSLPHSLLSLGGTTICVGTVIILCANVNRTCGVSRQKFDRLLLFVGGLQIFGAALFILEFTGTSLMHSSVFYVAVSVAFPATLLTISSVSHFRWPATVMAGIYSALFLGTLWVFPLFRARPHLGPVYQLITHMIPLWFPVLLIVPALILDITRSVLPRTMSRWASGVLYGVAYLVSFVTVQWPFAYFLMSRAAENGFFGRTYFAYTDPANILYDPHRFFATNITVGAFLRGMSLALLVSVLCCRAGIAMGEWLRNVQR